MLLFIIIGILLKTGKGKENLHQQFILIFHNSSFVDIIHVAIFSLLSSIFHRIRHAVCADQCLSHLFNVKE